MASLNLSIPFAIAMVLPMPSFSSEEATSVFSEVISASLLSLSEFLQEIILSASKSGKNVFFIIKCLAVSSKGTKQLNSINTHATIGNNILTCDITRLIHRKKCRDICHFCGFCNSFKRSST